MKPYSAVTRVRKHVGGVRLHAFAFAAVSRSADFSRDVTVLCYLRHRFISMQSFVNCSLFACLHLIPMACFSMVSYVM